MPYYPRLLPIRHRLYSRPLPDIRSTVHEAVAAALPHGLGKRRRIAITAGSRGISNIAVILRAAVDAVRARGGEPFVVPAMGSHGGATAQGQLDLLHDPFGVTPETMGCPVPWRGR